MKKYPKYKDSGVEWIGEIPEGWYMISLKHLVSTKITDGPHETPEFIDEGIPFLSVESVQDKKLDFNGKRGYISTEQHKEYSKKCKPRRDDVFLVKSGSTTGKSTIVETDEEFNIWSPLCIIRSDLSKTLPRFIFTSFQSDYFRKFIELGWSFGTQPNIGMGVIENIKIIIPTLNEQQHIIDFLDQKTTIIDDLIQKKQQKIELLKEHRNSIITQTVTKGLNPDVKMKDSEVEWIGDIPKGWIITKIKYETSLIVDGTHFTPNYIENGVPFLRVTDIQQDKIDFNKIKFISEEEHLVLSKRCNPKKDDLLLSKNGTIGITKIVDWDWEFSIFVSLCLIRFNVDFDPKLFSYFFQSDIVDQQLKESSKQSTVTNLHLEKIRELILIKPPFSEQQQIVQFLDQKTQEIDTTITLENQKIDLLKEYRQSLISEVVTGKIDVRKN